MTRRNVPESESRLVILRALRDLGPLTQTQLLRFFTETGLMDYFTMQLNLADMLELGLARETPHPLGALLTLTEEGRAVLGTLGRRVPHAVAQLLEDEGEAWKARFRAEQQTLAESFMLSDGRCCMHLRLLEGETALMDLMLTVDGSDKLSFLSERWQAVAPEAYAMVMQTLAQDYEAGGPVLDLPDTATLDPLALDAWLLALDDCRPDPTMTLMLTLSEEGLARWIAGAWVQKKEAIREGLMTAMRSAGEENRGN